MNENKYIEVGGRLHSIATGNILLGANEVFDDDKNKKQNDINTETYSLVNNINERLDSLSPDQQSALSVAAKATNNEAKLGYYICDTENNIAAKVISNATGYVLSNGGSIKIKMTNANTANDATLNINSTGPKPLYYDGERASANNSWEAGETVEVYYDGTRYYANNVAGSSGSGNDAFDVSVKYPTSGIEGGNTYTLQGALAVLNTNLSANKKKGGMSIKFIQSSDNKYIQARCMAQNFSTDTNDWQEVDAEPTVGSKNLVESGGVVNYVEPIYHRTQNIENSVEDGVYVTDDEGNVGACVDKDGKFDAIDFGDNLKGKINTIAEEKAEDVKEDLEETFDSIPLKEDITEEGFYIGDNNLNVGAKLTDKGFDAIKFGNNLYNQVPSQSDINIKIDREEEIPLSPLYVKKSTGVTKQLTIPSVGAKEKWIQTVRLHYKGERGNKAANDVFFDGDCETDFSDVRFFDANGNIIKAVLGVPANIDIVECSLSGSYVFVCPNGNIIASGDSYGIRISTDGGRNYTAVAGMGNGFTEHASNVYNLTSMCIVFVDDNNDLFGYAGGKLYRLTYASNYLSYTEVLDFSYVNGQGTTIYPDIQPHAMAKDKAGNYYVGTYQVTSERHAAVYVSTDGGNTFSLSYLPDNTSDFGKDLQHVHHIQADKYTSAVYVDIDGDGTKRGPVVVKTKDAGTTWIDMSYTFRVQRGRDYFPNYIGTDFMLGGGESMVLGGGAIARWDNNKQEMSIPLEGSAGCRSIIDLGSENVLLAATQSNSLAEEHQFLISYDKGKTWDIIAVEETSNDSSSGNGYRHNYSLQSIAGEEEQCAILCFSNKSKKVFAGNDNYYREAYLLMEDVPSGDISITVKSGYKNEYPYKNIRGIEYEDNLVYEVPLSEGFGNVVHDSLGNHAVVNGSVNWEDINARTVRYGDITGLGGMKEKKIHSAARFAGVVNFGKIPALNFKKNFTITFWLNEKAVANDYAQADALGDQYDNKGYTILKAGAFRLMRYNPSVGMSSRDNYYPRNTRYIEGGLRYSSDYKFYAIVVEEGTFKVYVNGSPAFTQAGTEAYTGFNDKNLSEEDFIIGTDNNNIVGYLSDIKIYNKALTNAEVTNLYKGFNFI